MKKSKDFKRLRTLTIASACWGLLALYVNMPGATVVCFVMAFIAWYATPHHDKYEEVEDITDEYHAEVNARIRQEEELAAEMDREFMAYIAQDMAQQVLESPEDYGLIHEMDEDQMDHLGNALDNMDYMEDPYDQPEHDYPC